MRLFPIVLLASVLGCGGHVPVLRPSPDGYKHYSSPADGTELYLMVPSWIASGDTVEAYINAKRCGSGACEWRRDSGSFTLNLDAPTVASADARGRIRFHRPGVVRVTATRGDTVLVQTVQVLAPVASLAWEPNVSSARVGEVIRTKAVARDSSGRAVAIVPVSLFNVDGPTERIHLHWESPTGTVFAGNEPARAQFVARLGHRTAVLNVTFRER